ncbi:MAG: DUF4832 domain-containing protein [Planctomycetota bacterium]
MRPLLIFSVSISLGLLHPPSQAETWQTLRYAAAPVDNPLKGLVPYQTDVRSRFPHSLEFNYLPYSGIVKGYDDFDWSRLEVMLDDIASRGHQAVLRIFLEYPGKQNVIPQFLIDDGLTVHKYVNTNTHPLPPTDVETPDYEDPNLRRSLEQFLAAFGREYDGDPRIGFITAGLLGTWGEWHTYPRTELFASKTVQREVMSAYESAFKTTPILLRYPAGKDHYATAKNADRGFGYHDDSFAWATLETGKKGDEWFYMTALRDAGANDKWKRYPIGGEIRPEAWGKVFDEQPGLPEIQDFRTCVRITHATWLMDSGMFATQQTPQRIERAKEQVRRMGYEFHCPRVRIENLNDGKLNLALEIENRGVAPFYYEWKAQWGLLRDGKVIKTFPASGRLKELLPDDTPRRWSDSLDLSPVAGGNYVIAVKVPNPMPGGFSMRFANETQDADAVGWLSLGNVNVESR